MRPFQLLLCMAMFSGCATHWERGEPVTDDADSKREAVGDAMQTPMRDMNLLREEIPEVLNRAMAAPYAMPDPMECDAFAAEIRALDAVLGEDIDSRVVVDGEESLALRAFVSGVQGLMPYRGWVRKLSGAEKRDRRALAAIAAGSVRRGYLKGVGETHGCDVPAAPKRD
jgi:hypothetical protein